MTATASLWPDVRGAYDWVHRVAQVLTNEPPLPGAAVKRRLGGLLGALTRHQATAVRDVVHPAGLHATFEALEQGMAAHEPQHQAIALALAKARYEAQRARRHYDRGDPDHRLGAGELERRWNEA